MEHRTYKAQLYDGQWFEIRLLDDGRFVCPVCGLILEGEPPYHRGEWESDGRFTGVAKTDTAIGSQNICPCCSTQYGEDDLVADFDGLTQEEVWSRLRGAWLVRRGSDRAALDQLERNLAVAPGRNASADLPPPEADHHPEDA